MRSLGLCCEALNETIQLPVFPHQSVDLFHSVQHRCMISAPERISDAGETQVRQFSGQVHGKVAGTHNGPPPYHVPGPRIDGPESPPHRRFARGQRSYNGAARCGKGQHSDEERPGAVWSRSAPHNTSQEIALNTEPDKLTRIVDISLMSGETVYEPTYQ